MKQEVRVAKALVRLAKSLVADEELDKEQSKKYKKEFQNAEKDFKRIKIDAEDKKTSSDLIGTYKIITGLLNKAKQHNAISQKYYEQYMNGELLQDASKRINKMDQDVDLRFDSNTLDEIHYDLKKVFHAIISHFGTITE